MMLILLDGSPEFLKFQGMLDDFNTKETVAHSSQTDMEELDF